MPKKVRKKGTSKGDPWTSQEEMFLRQHFRTKRLSQIASEMGRSIFSVANKAQVMGLRIRRRWTKEEIAYVADHLNVYPLPQIAKELFREVTAVREMMKREGLRITDDVEMTIKTVAKKIGLSQSVLYYHIKTGELKVLGRHVGASQSYMFDLKDVRDFIVKALFNRNLKCYTCGTKIKGDMFCQKHLDHDYKPKPQLPHQFIVHIKDRNYRPSLTKALVAIRTNACLNQDTVSELCGHEATWYGRFERMDKPQITIDQLIDVCKVLGYEIDITIKKQEKKE